MTPEESYNPFVRNQTIVDPKVVFTWKPKAVRDIKDKCIIVLDTNVLLIPYTVGKHTLGEISGVYERLAKQKRLIVPAQVAREFAYNRVAKQSEMLQSLASTRAKLVPPDLKPYPLLDMLDEYSVLKENVSEARSKLDAAQETLKKLIEKLSSAEWDDPVSDVYSRVLGGSIHDIEIDEQKLKDDLKYRFDHKIPPGYKDAAKEDSGVGDLLIWKTILDIGSTRNSDLMFVTGEEKSDWWHLFEKRPLAIRHELVEEYRRVSGGKTFQMLKLSDLLELFNVPEEVVTEVKGSELEEIQKAPATIRHSDRLASEARWRQRAGHTGSLEYLLSDRIIRCLTSQFEADEYPRAIGNRFDLVLRSKRGASFDYLVNVRSIHNVREMNELHKFDNSPAYFVENYFNESGRYALYISIFISEDPSTFETLPDTPFFVDFRLGLANGLNSSILRGSYVLYAMDFDHLVNLDCRTISGMFPLMER